MTFHCQLLGNVRQNKTNRNGIVQITIGIPMTMTQFFIINQQQDEDIAGQQSTVGKYLADLSTQIRVNE